MLLTDRFGLIEYFNPKFTELTGYAAEEVIGQKTNILKSGETPTEVYAQLWRTVESGGEWRGEFHNRRRNGELYWESGSISALRDSAGVITNFVAVKEDITERKRLESEVEQRNQELAHSSLDRHGAHGQYDRPRPAQSPFFGQDGHADPKQTGLR